MAFGSLVATPEDLQLQRLLEEKAKRVGFNPSAPDNYVVADQPAVRSTDSFDTNNINTSNIINQLVAQSPNITREAQARGDYTGHPQLSHFLGKLADAFLVQSGNKPQYATKIKDAAIADSLGQLDSNPTTAVAGIAANDPDLAVKVMTANQMREYRQAQAEAAQTKAQEAKLKNTYTRALSLMGAANGKTYPAVRQRYYDYLKAQGVDPLVDFPDTYDKDTVSQLLRTGMTNAQQSQADYRDARLDQFDQGLGIQQGSLNERIRNDITNNGIAGGRLSETKRHNGVSEIISGQNAVTREMSAGDRRRNIDSTIRSRSETLRLKSQPKPADIDYLKANPDQRAQFDAHFGAGTAARILGK